MLRVKSISICFPQQQLIIFWLAAANCSNSQSRYLLAQCCLRLGKLNEAEQALNPDGDPQKGEVSFASFLTPFTNGQRFGPAVLSVQLKGQA